MSSDPSGPADRPDPAPRETGEPLLFPAELPGQRQPESLLGADFFAEAISSFENGEKHSDECEPRGDRDPFRPLLHITPPRGCLTSSGGICHWQGRWHIFYQVSPAFPREHRLCWAHTASDDLLRWDPPRIVLLPDQSYDTGGCGYGSMLSPSAAEESVESPQAAPALSSGAPLRFFYTGNVKGAQGWEAYQCAAEVSGDNQLLVRKSPGNPLFSGPPEGYSAHFRGSQVFRNPEPEGSPPWLMLLGAQRLNAAESAAAGAGVAYLLGSADLKRWRPVGELKLSQPIPPALMWECPQLFSLVDELSGRRRQVLIFCPQTEHEGQRRDFAGYVVGDWAGGELKNCSSFRRLDWGAEFYAPRVSAEGGELIGWVGMPGQDRQPSLGYGWAHALSFPRRLRLVDDQLLQVPSFSLPDCSRVFSGLPGRLSLAAEGVPAFYRLSQLDESDASWMRFQARLGSAEARLRLRLRETENQRLIINLDQQQIRVDRSATLYPGAAAKPGVPTVFVAPTPDLGSPAEESGLLLEVLLILDRSVCEIFVTADAGACEDKAQQQTTLTFRSFFGEPGGESYLDLFPGVTVENLEGGQLQLPKHTGEKLAAS